MQIQQTGNGAGPHQMPTAAQLAQAIAVLRAQPGTAHAVTLYGNQVTVSGVSQQVQSVAFDGPSAWTGYALIAGHWYDGPGEVDVNTSFLDASGLAIGDSTTVDTGSAEVTVRIVGEVFAPSRQPRLYGATQTLPGIASIQNFWQVDVGLRPGTSTTSYIQAVNRKLGANGPVRRVPPDTGQFYVIASALIGFLALMVAIAAGLGVLNTVLMTTRDRVHDLGVFKALGMRPGQIVTMVICWIAVPAIVAAAMAAPAAVALNDATLHAMGATAHTGIPASFSQVFGPVRLALLSLAAVAIAVAGALLPALWAARTRPATALRRRMTAGPRISRTVGTVTVEQETTAPETDRPTRRCGWSSARTRCCSWPAWSSSSTARASRSSPPRATAPRWSTRSSGSSPTW